MKGKDTNKADIYVSRWQLQWCDGDPRLGRIAEMGLGCKVARVDDGQMGRGRADLADNLITTLD